MKKQICAFAAALMLVCAMPSSLVHASAPDLETPVIDVVAPAYVYADEPINTLSISSNGMATCVSTINGNSSVTKIEATQYLEKKGLIFWHEVARKSASTTKKSLTITNTVDISGEGEGKYRVRVEATVSTSNGSETVKGTGDTVSYP
ncbi:MAG: hypothetical protein K2I93_05455 [Oscillospiraceae bacterium]|nr:hypothetical protein [Oscillospiraceae bacterium]